MFKYLPIFAILILITISCSTKQIPSYYYQESIDSTNIVASVQPIEYPWNSEGHLVDLMRQKYETLLLLVPFIFYCLLKTLDLILLAFIYAL